MKWGQHLLAGPLRVSHPPPPVPPPPPLPSGGIILATEDAQLSPDLVPNHTPPPLLPVAILLMAGCTVHREWRVTKKSFKIIDPKSQQSAHTFCTSECAPRTFDSPKTSTSKPAVISILSQRLLHPTSLPGPFLSLKTHPRINVKKLSLLPRYLLVS